MNIGAKLGHLAFKSIVGLLGLLSWGAAYKISDFLSFLFYKVIRYRYKVMEQNIRLCYPEWSALEVDALVRKNYAHLSDLLIESLKGFSQSGEALMAKSRFLNAELIKADLGDLPRCIISAAHITNFEWAAMSIGAYTKVPLVAFYKPLHNVYIDKDLKVERAKMGTTMVSIKQTAQCFEDYASGGVMFGLLSDQGPSSVNKAVWAKFFNQTVPCMYGLGHYAILHNLPIYYVNGRRIGRGQYENVLEPLCLNPTEKTAEEILQIFMSRVEAHVREIPEQWLWTHRRFRKAKQAERL